MNRNETDWSPLLQAASSNLEYLAISNSSGVHRHQDLNFNLPKIQTLKLAVHNVTFFTKLLSLCSNNLKDIQVNADYMSMTTERIESNFEIPANIESVSWHHTHHATFNTSYMLLAALLSKCAPSLVSLEINQRVRMVLPLLVNQNIKFQSLKHLTIRTNRFNFSQAFNESSLESLKIFSDETFHDNEDLKRFLEIQSKTLKSLNITMRDFNIQDIENFDLQNYLGL